jgi:hypothetical protein
MHSPPPFGSGLESVDPFGLGLKFKTLSLLIDIINPKVETFKAHKQSSLPFFLL